MVGRALIALGALTFAGLSTVTAIYWARDTEPLKQPPPSGRMQHAAVQFDGAKHQDLMRRRELRFQVNGNRGCEEGSHEQEVEEQGDRVVLPLGSDLIP